MRRIQEWIESWRHPTLEQKYQIVSALKFLLLAFVLPTVLLFLLFRSHYWQIALFVALADGVCWVIVRYGPSVYASLLEKSKQKETTKLAETQRRHDEMLYFVEPSLFTRRFSSVSDEDLIGKTYVDDAAHWIVAVRLFFNPFAERRGPLPEYRVARSTIVFVRGLVKVLLSLLAVGWAMIFGFLFASIFPDVFPPSLRPSINGIPWWIVITGIITIAGTALWARYAIKLWLRERLTITTERYFLTSRRNPFQNDEDLSGSLDYLMSASLIRTYPGRLLGYGHIKFQSWEDPEPIKERLFVAHPERVKAVLDHFTTINSKKSKAPLKTRKSQGAA